MISRVLIAVLHSLGGTDTWNIPKVRGDAVCSLRRASMILGPRFLADETPPVAIAGVDVVGTVAGTPRRGAIGTPSFCLRDCRNDSASRRTRVSEDSKPKAFFPVPVRHGNPEAVVDNSNLQSAQDIVFGDVPTAIKGFQFEFAGAAGAGAGAPKEKAADAGGAGAGAGADAVSANGNAPDAGLGAGAVVVPFEKVPPSELFPGLIFS